MSKVKNIGVFGRRNSGKSSLINTICGQDIAIVSDTPGTTTDPVKKRMEMGNSELPEQRELSVKLI